MKYVYPVGITYKRRDQIVNHSCTFVKLAILRSILNSKAPSEEAEIIPHDLSMKSICNSNSY